MTMQYPSWNQVSGFDSLVFVDHPHTSEKEKNLKPKMWSQTAVSTLTPQLWSQPAVSTKPQPHYCLGVLGLLQLLDNQDLTARYLQNVFSKWRGQHHPKQKRCQQTTSKHDS